MLNEIFYVLLLIFKPISIWKFFVCSSFLSVFRIRVCIFHKQIWRYKLFDIRAYLLYHSNSVFFLNPNIVFLCRQYSEFHDCYGFKFILRILILTHIRVFNTDIYIFILFYLMPSLCSTRVNFIILNWLWRQWTARI